MTLKIAISIDDVCPKSGFGLFLKNGALKYPEKLYEEFDMKFTLFIVPIFENNPQFDIRNNLSWIKQLKESNYYEIAAHGITHKAQSPENEAQELVGLSLDDIQRLVLFSKDVFKDCNIDVFGFKTPGWTQPKEIYDFLKYKYQYIADHFIGSSPINYNNLLRIPYTHSIDRIIPEYGNIYKDGYLILHSHIYDNNGKTKNSWTKENYEKVRNLILKLKENNIEIEFITFKDIK